MARSLASNLSICALALVVVAGTAAQDDGANTDAFEFASESMTFDGQRNVFELVKPELIQGDLRIVADEAVATSIEFDQESEWRFTGRVRLGVGTTVIEADRAVFTFENEQLARGELEGAPVSFSDIDAAVQRSVTGRAQKMSYDYVARTLRMTGSPARIQKNKVEMQGCDLIYDFTAERMTSGSADCADQFRLRRLPDSDARAAPDAPP